jgi:hypothetical protein
MVSNGYIVVRRVESVVFLRSAAIIELPRCHAIPHIPRLQRVNFYQVPPAQGVH